MSSLESGRRPGCCRGPGGHPTTSSGDDHSGEPCSPHSRAGVPLAMTQAAFTPLPTSPPLSRGFKGSLCTGPVARLLAGGRPSGLHETLLPWLAVLQWKCPLHAWLAPSLPGCALMAGQGSLLHPECSPTLLLCVVPTLWQPSLSVGPSRQPGMGQRGHPAQHPATELVSPHPQSHGSCSPAPGLCPVGVACVCERACVSVWVCEGMCVKVSVCV